MVGRRTKEADEKENWAKKLRVKSRVIIFGAAISSNLHKPDLYSPFYDGHDSPVKAPRRVDG